MLRTPYMAISLYMCVHICLLLLQNEARGKMPLESHIVDTHFRKYHSLTNQEIG